MKTRYGLVCGLLCLLLILLACGSGASPAASPTAKPASPSPTAAKPGGAVSFAGKTITLVVPVSAGGGTDLGARVYAQYLSKFLPGTPTIVVRNMPGGSGTIGANFVHDARPDGLTGLVVAGSAVVAQLMGMKAVRYDIGKMPVAVAVTAGGLYYAKAGVVDKPEDIMKATNLLFGHTTGTPGSLYVVAKELIGFQSKVVLAYTGSGDARRAFLAGETNVSYDSGQAYNETLAAMVAKKEIVTLFQTGVLDASSELIKDAAFPPEILTTKELHERITGKAPSGTVWEAYKGVLALMKNYDNILAFPQGTPDNVMRAYWTAAETIVKDAAFRKMVDPLVGKDAGWQAGEALNKAYKQNFAIMKPEIVTWYRTTMAKYGVSAE